MSGVQSRAVSNQSKHVTISLSLAYVPSGASRPTVSSRRGSACLGTPGCPSRRTSRPFRGPSSRSGPTSMTTTWPSCRAKNTWRWWGPASTTPSLRGRAAAARSRWAPRPRWARAAPGSTCTSTRPRPAPSPRTSPRTRRCWGNCRRIPSATAGRRCLISSRPGTPPQR